LEGELKRQREILELKERELASKKADVSRKQEILLINQREVR
jgi:hypothetical protein